MLNGIGGRTIAEAQERLCARETQLWSSYRARHGGFNFMQRADYNAGLLASLYANAHRAKGAPAYQISDFTRFIDQQPISLEQAMANWG
ncbi:hypothetical protein D3C81_353630 [compost metagenome]